MTKRASDSDMGEAWDRASDLYLARRSSDVTAVSYGNLAPSEDDLRLLGDVRGKRLLDIGCGGGQNTVACALAGATVVGVDVSRAQLVAARHLARVHDVDVEWYHGDFGTVEMGGYAPFDFILAIQVLPYVADARAVVIAARQLLAPGGRFIVSVDHPVRNCFYDEESEELSPYPVRSYDLHAPLVWNFAAGVPMKMNHYPLGQWIGWLVEAGLRLMRVIEAPAPPAVCDEMWPEDSPLAPLRNIPHTAILVAHAPP